MLIFRIFSVVTLVLLSGCSYFSLKSEALEESVGSNKSAEVKEKIPSKELNKSIEPDVLYILLTAELAGQRGQYDIALEGYLLAAKKTKDPRFSERAVMIAMYIKDNSRTNEALSLWLTQDPKNQSARKIATLMALRSGDKALALTHLNALLDFDQATFEGVLLEITTVLEKEEKQALVSDALDAMLIQHPNLAEIYFIQSLLAIQNKDRDLAEAKIKQALKYRPDWDKALLCQAQIDIYAGDLSEASALLKKALVKYPNNLKMSKMLAQVFIKDEHYKEALDLYHKMISNNPSDVESQFAEGLIYLQLNQEDEAEGVFKKLEGQDEWKYQADFYLGKIKEKQGSYKKALEFYDKVSDGAFVFDASLSAISLLQRDKQVNEANARLSALQSKFPKQIVRLTLIQAELFSQQKNYEKSFEILSKALAENLNQKEYLYARALIAEHLGKLDVVEGDLNKILAIEPDNVETLNALGYSLLNNPSRYVDAEKFLKKALSLSPNEAVIIDSYGWLQFKLGNFSGALNYLQQAYDKQKEPEIAAHLAEVMWVSGKRDEAEKLVSRLIRENPADEYLKDVEKRIFKGAK